MTGGSGVTPTLGAEELLAAVPQLRDGPNVVARSLMQVPGANLTFADLDMLAIEIRKELADGASGVVVIQGTDTLEETSFALDILLADVTAPIIFTGAMRNPTLPGPDGPANIYASVHCAASPVMRGRGVTLLMNDTIHAAIRVQKRHASRTDAFGSSPHGPLGWFQEGAPVIIDESRTRLEIPGAGTASVHVPLISVTLDPDLTTWEAILGSGIDGLVVEGFGVGHVPERLAPLLVKAAQELPVVLATRTRGGSVHTRTYGFVGSERYLLERGLISAGWLDPIKARILSVMAIRSGVVHLAETFRPVNPA